MGQQILLNLLIFCLILSQGFASLANNASADSSDPLMRTKRVVDRTANANTRVRLRDISYVVNVQENGIHACAGTILSPRVILVPCSCVMNVRTYTVISGTLATRGGKSHTVTGILRHPNCEPHSHIFNIALLSIDEPIAIGPNSNEPITIFESNHGQLRPNTPVIVSGYGLAIDHRNGGILSCSNGGQQRQVMPKELRSIRLPTISTQDCAVRHNNDPEITPQNIICTFHENKFCGPGDSGSPLVYESYLFGILSFDVYDGHARPAIFVNVAAPVQRNWIYENINRIPRYVVTEVRPDNQPALEQNQPRRRNMASKVNPING